jgi:hypothetical protein
MEDPNDGYRSAMKELRISAEPITNMFPAVDVVAHHRTQGKFSGMDDVLELIDVANGKVVLEVGTDNVDDYYPGFVANWIPKNLAINQAKGV